MMTRQEKSDERRKTRRVPVDFPVTVEIHGTPVSGWALNACNSGMMVQSFMTLDMALHVLHRLKKNGMERLFLEFTHKEPCRTQADLRHFHLEFLGSRLCRSRAGFSFRFHQELT